MGWEGMLRWCEGLRDVWTTPEPGGRDLQESAEGCVRNVGSEMMKRATLSLSSRQAFRIALQ